MDTAENVTKPMPVSPRICGTKLSTISALENTLTRTTVFVIPRGYRLQTKAEQFTGHTTECIIIDNRHSGATMQNTTEHVFISYVRENSSIVDRLASDLKMNGVHVWLDRNEILPGQNWKDAIGQAINSGAFFIACFSEEMRSRDETFMHGEIRTAIDRLRMMPRERTWFIPVMLNPTEIPKHSISDHENISDINFIKLFEDWNASVNKILIVLGADNKDVQAVRRLRRTCKENNDTAIKTIDVLLDKLSDFHKDSGYILSALGHKSPEIRLPTIDKIRDNFRASFEILEALDEFARKFQIQCQDFLGGNSDIAGTIYDSLSLVGKVGPYLDYLTTDLKRLVEESGDAKTSGSAVRTLGMVGTVESGAYSYLCDLLSDRNCTVQEDVIAAIGRFKKSAAPIVPKLISIFPNSSLSIKREILEAIGRIGHVSEDELAFLCSALEDSDDQIRLSASEALWFIARVRVHNSAIANALIEKLDDTSSRVRKEKIDVLDRTKKYGPEHLPEITKILTDRDMKNVTNALWMLEVLGPDAKTAASAIADTLSLDDDDVKKAALGALEAIGPAASVATPEIMSIYLSAGDQRLGSAAYAALEAIFGDS